MANLISIASIFILGVLAAIKKYWLLIFLFCLIPFYAFIITILGNSPQIENNTLEIIRLFKEVIFCGIFLGLLWNMYASKQKITFQLADFFVALYLLVLVGSIFVHHSSLREALFGIRYDFIFFFYYFVFRLYFKFYAATKENLISIILITSLPVFIFALLQFFILPQDFLVHFGYAKTALPQFDPFGPIPAYQLLGNSNLIRVQSFFSGPNQLAAYSLIILFLSLGKILTPAGSKIKIISYLVLILGLITLVLTFSRSAWVGFLVGIILLAIINYKRQPIFSGLVLGSTIAAVALIFGLFKQNLYEIIIRPSSTLWHITYLKDAYTMIMTHPFGLGLSKVGPASQWLNQALVSESFYLQIALEVGVFGLLLFLIAFVLLSIKLIKQKTQFGLILFASLVSVLVASLFLHTLADGILAIYLGFVLALGSEEANLDYETIK